MHQINLSDSGHTWKKQNLVTITTNKGSYDIMKCVMCGVEGKVYNLTDMRVSEKYPLEATRRCKFYIPKKVTQIKITRCGAVGPMFENLTPGSIHDTVKPPPPYKEDPKGVWVMGVGEPVKVLNGEYTKVD